MCFFRVPASPNEFPHCAHLCTFSPVWVIMCVLKVSARPNDFLHSGQVWVFSPLWVSNFQTVSKTEWLLALHTSVSLFFAVSDHVPLQTSCSIKWFLTFWTNLHIWSTASKQKPRPLALVSRIWTLPLTEFYWLRFDMIRLIWSLSLLLSRLLCHSFVMKMKERDILKMIGPSP